MNTVEHLPTILVHAYGNPGRSDDGLGNAFVDVLDNWIHEHHITNVKTDSTYQLNIEDAYQLSEYDIVVFVDASMLQIDGFKFEVIVPEELNTFTTHALSPSMILYLCKELYGHEPESYLLSIRGYNWEQGDQLSEEAEKNLRLALQFMRSILRIHHQLQHWQSLQPETV